MDFIFNDGLQILGGFAGYGASDPDQRDPALNVTILSGDIDGIPDTGEWDDASRSDNADQVIFVYEIREFNSHRARVDGFTIRAGRDLDPFFLSGGGIWINSSAIDIVNCIFEDNSAGRKDIFEVQDGFVGWGGAASIVGYRPAVETLRSTRFIDCTFRDNTASRGGALAVRGALNPTDLTEVEVINCVFHDNQALTMMDPAEQDGGITPGGRRCATGGRGACACHP